MVYVATPRALGAVSRRSPRQGRGGSFVQDLRRRTTFFDARGAARCSRCRWEATTTTNNNNKKKKAMAMTMTIIIFGCLIFLHMGCLITRGQLGSRTRICQNHQKSPQSWLPWFGASRGQCFQERSSKTTEVCHHFTVCSRGAAIITHLRKFFFSDHACSTVSFPVFANFRWNDHVFPGL